jgi:hypothetical protein
VAEERTLMDEDYELYREFWQSNLQTIHRISKDLERSLVDLERQSLSFDGCYRMIESKLDTLHAIYRSYATMEGDEYILKLKALVADHRSSIEKQKVSFNIIHFLLDRIRDYEAEKIARFPDTVHAEQKIGYKPIPLSLAENARFKWISFLRNGSWFLARYDKARVVPASDTRFQRDPRKGAYMMMEKDTSYTVKDIFASAPDSQTPASFIITETGEVSCFAADRAGKRIIASTDVLAVKTEPFAEKSSFAKGFVRIAGTRYILLRDAQSSS